MSWVNNNKKNARFDPNRKDDRLLLAEVISRREPRRKKEVEPTEELVSTDPEFVGSMQADRDSFGLVPDGIDAAATGKLKTDKIFRVISDPRFTSNAGSAKSALKSTMLANLHLFSGKQKKTVEAIVNGIGGVSDEREQKAATSDSESTRSRRASGRKRRSSSSSSSSSSKSSSPSRSHKKRKKKKSKD
eukprot:CAMPEP_0169185466 /NCGR_PEP_ID=MMETSP1016-20121227/1810_1 /TAXON_ID=342587 /ORGANISM="Karlodinium micrum, Strain CCMP2283" /LENGTH=188 /DNA_ID=CAMNT_0009261169 /DNA_START=103 /DNA_END=667 /DNA_ORIENTATION=-